MQSETKEQYNYINKLTINLIIPMLISNYFFNTKDISILGY